MSGAGEHGSAKGSDTGDLMDAIYRWQRPIYDATRKYYLLGRDRLVRELDPPAGGTVLELGCGTARNLILAARRHPQARFLGIDISSQMLGEAERSVARAGLADRIQLARADASDFDLQALFGQPAVERVFLSYALSMRRLPPVSRRWARKGGFPWSISGRWSAIRASCARRFAPGLPPFTWSPGQGSTRRWRQRRPRAGLPRPRAGSMAAMPSTA
jgi:SAM-dependent methyltransferase